MFQQKREILTPRNFVPIRGARVCREDYRRRQVGECADCVLPFCDVHIDKGTTLKLLQYLHVICGCRAVQTVTNSAEAPLTGTAAYVAIVSRPVYTQL